MVLDLKTDTVLSYVIAGIPKVAELIAALPEERRPRALEAAEQSYLKTARALGYDEADAQQWASTVMFRLRAEMPQGAEEDAALSLVPALEGA